MRSTGLTVFAVIAVAALALASVGATQTVAKGPSGKELYKSFCKPCHGPGSENGEYSPLTLIQDQWERFFDKKLVKSHEGAMDPNGGGKLLDVLDTKTLEQIKKFSIDHAADSESPMTCG